jgi:hypothetical protein
LRLTIGPSQNIYGGTVLTWARIQADGTVEEVGVTLPLSTVVGAPAHDYQPGPGPAGALAVLDFPPGVRQTTFVDHFQLHWAPAGHPPPGIFTDVPHFDVHFFAATVAEVQAIRPGNALPRPAANRVPADYVVPDTDQGYMREVVPQMGFHAMRAAVLRPGYRFMEPEIVLGFHRGQLHLIEPMLPRDWMLQRSRHVMEIPRPPVLGRVTRYPTRVTTRFDDQESAFQIALSEFVPVE